MEWFKAISQLVSALVWPGIVLAVILIFRRELRHVLGAIKEVKYPGGSITVEVARLEERLASAPTRDDRRIAPDIAMDFLSGASDPQLAVAQLRTDVEKEVFHLSLGAPWITNAWKD